MWIPAQQILPFTVHVTGEALTTDERDCKQTKNNRTNTKGAELTQRYPEIGGPLKPEGWTTSNRRTSKAKRSGPVWFCEIHTDQHQPSFTHCCTPEGIEERPFRLQGGELVCLADQIKPLALTGGSRIGPGECGRDGIEAGGDGGPGGIGKVVFVSHHIRFANGGVPGQPG